MRFINFRLCIKGCCRFCFLWGEKSETEKPVFHFPLTSVLAPRAGNMNQILHCDWPPEQARWSYLACSGLLAVSRNKNFSESLRVNPLLAKFVLSRWLDIGLLLSFCEFIDLDSFSVHKHAGTELGQYPAIFDLTSFAHLISPVEFQGPCY